MKRWFITILTFGILSVCLWRTQVKGAALPEWPQPPQQNAPWTAPASPLTNVLSAVQTLFAQGFPDPRGCEYREVEVNVGSLHSETGTRASTHGWVLPQKNGAPQRFVICWNGVIYPALKIGEPVDLKKDIADLKPLDERRLRYASTESYSIKPTDTSISRVLLLLRLKETDAAEKNWVFDRKIAADQIYQRTKVQAENPDFNQYDPYAELAAEWAWAMYDHAILSHMRGDVETALATARKLSSFEKVMEAEAQRRGIPRPQDYSSQNRTNLPYLVFLQKLPRLEKDLERRWQEPKPATKFDLQNNYVVAPKKRVAALIAEMDQIVEPQRSQPGIVHPEESRIGQALIHEREAAVEPLLECMENDQRLTRSIGYSRDFFRDRVIISVSRAACMTLQQILQVPYDTLPEMKAYWAENKGQKSEDRWYKMLQDDNAGTGQWILAAESILQPSNVKGVPGSGFSMTTPLPPGEKPVFRGESLRGRKTPSVTELLARRAEQLITRATKTDQSMAVEDLNGANRLTRLLAQWEPKAAVQPAQQAMHRAIELYADPRSFIMSSGRDLAPYIAQWTQIRITGGDATALTEYLAWLKTFTLKGYSHDLLEIIEPIWSNPKAPEVVAAGEWMFADVNSPWAAILWQHLTIQRTKPAENGRPWSDEGIFDLGFTQIPAFQKLILTELDNKENIGWIQYEGKSHISLEVKNLRMSQGFKEPPDFHPPMKIKLPVRHCDWIAWKLLENSKTAVFNPFAAQEERDQAMAAARDVVKGWQQAP